MSDQWQPIASAPKQGQFLGWDGATGVMAVCEMENIGAREPMWKARPVSWAWDYDDIPTPTHWMPLPEAPKA